MTFNTILKGLATTLPLLKLHFILLVLVSFLVQPSGFAQSKKAKQKAVQEQYILANPKGKFQIKKNKFSYAGQPITAVNGKFSLDYSEQFRGLMNKYSQTRRISDETKPYFVVRTLGLALVYAALTYNLGSTIKRYLNPDLPSDSGPGLGTLIPIAIGGVLSVGGSITLRRKTKKAMRKFNELQGF